MKIHLEKFDYLRALAILLVFGFHSMTAVFGNYEFPEFRTLFVNVNNLSLKSLLLNLSPFSSGDSGVILFLLISGFLIHFSYLKNQNPFNFKSFIFNRFFRIYPPYLIVLIFFSLITSTLLSKDFFFHLFLIHNLRNFSFYSINPSFWSLALEWQLYLLYPFYLLFSKKIGFKKTFLVIALISISTVFIRIIFNINYLPFQTSAISYWIIWIIGAHLANRFYENKQFKNISYLGLLIFLIFIMALKLTIIYKYINPYLFAIFYALLIEKIINNNANPIISKTSTFIKNIGLCSYSIYLLHQPVLNILKDNIFLTYHSTLIIKFIILLMSALLIGLLSWIFYKYVELNSVLLSKKFKNKILNSTL